MVLQKSILRPDGELAAFLQKFFFAGPTAVLDIVNHQCAILSHSKHLPLVLVGSSKPRDDGVAKARWSHTSGRQNCHK
jgi:hypothetical protein